MGQALCRPVRVRQRGHLRAHRDRRPTYSRKYQHQYTAISYLHSANSDASLTRLLYWYKSTPSCVTMIVLNDNSDITVNSAYNDNVVTDTNIQRKDQQGDVRHVPDRGARVVRLLLAVARGVRGAEGVQSS